MQLIKLPFNNNCFYCPVTGEQLLFETDYHCSPATLFFYSSLNGDNLIEPTPEIETWYQEALDEVANGMYSEYDFASLVSDAAKAFEILVHIKLKDKSNYVLFELDSDSVLSGASSDTIFIGIDMGYTPVLESTELNKDDFEKCFVGFDTYETVLHEATLVAPSTEGYALFMEDTLGCGGFYFITTAEEWETLLPSFVVLDYVNQDSATISPVVFESMKKVYFDYFNSWFYDALPLDFTKDLNALLTDYKVVFFGKVTDLFEASSEFSSELLEEYGATPIEDVDGFLSFLSTYSKY